MFIFFYNKNYNIVIDHECFGIIFIGNVGNAIKRSYPIHRTCNKARKKM